MVVVERLLIAEKFGLLRAAFAMAVLAGDRRAWLATAAMRRLGCVACRKSIIVADQAVDKVIY